MPPETEFLTLEECAEVDRALLTAREKFSTRVAIYALRSLKQIAREAGGAIAQLQTYQIVEWVAQDDSLRQGADPDFKRFFAQLVNSARQPLSQAAAQIGRPVEDLTVTQVVDWFEQESKKNLDQRG